MQIITANYVDAFKKEIYPSEISFDKKIMVIKKLGDSIDKSLPYILPGFIDAHVHIESSMLIPSEFARVAVTHGTVATISDPHEIANVCGMEGVKYMIENGKKTPFKFYFGAPSCVPATVFETAGATIDSDGVKGLLLMDEIKYLAEMMNFPGVLNGDEEVLKKIAHAYSLNKPVDGHAPGLRGEEAKKYIDAGISTDHECFTKEEALDKLKYGMKILIREGSAAKNFEALIDLLDDYEDEIMLCSDDKHPDSLVLGHINQLCSRAVAKGIDIFKIVKAACINPVFHYKLDVGLLRVNEPADFVLLKDLKSFEVLKTYIDGKLVAQNGQTCIASIRERIINNFAARKIKIEDLRFEKADFFRNENGEVPVIEALDGQLITNKIFLLPKTENEYLVSDVSKDMLKMVVINRYLEAPIAKAFIKNFGLKKGAIASSVAHDSHNIVAVGVDDKSISEAVNAIISSGGGISVTGNKMDVLPLPVTGLMSNGDAYEISKKYADLDNMAKELHSELSAPFMTLSFMALLVIPHLKLSDRGLFDGDSFSFIQKK
ncbi:adenine deaminase [Arachidicoccus sp.]|uniref:adenine deaminase n=1 Tax=Arachidicoccus sp. TaxID=1872624 RepID=UPI003D1BF0AD